MKAIEWKLAGAVLAGALFFGIFPERAESAETTKADEVVVVPKDDLVQLLRLAQIAQIAIEQRNQAIEERNRLNDQIFRMRELDRKARAQCM
jgi:hypothetical protein